MSTLPGKKTNVYSEIRNSSKLLVDGIVLSCDPSMGSMSSMPGYAIFDAGELVVSGVLSINPAQEKWQRLKEVYRQLRNISLFWKVDCCVYEQIPVSAHAGRSQVSHASLLMAVGVTMAAVDARSFVGIPPVTWKKYVSPGYIKGDEEDARQMGRIVIDMAREIHEKDPHRKYKETNNE